MRRPSRFAPWIAWIPGLVLTCLACADVGAAEGVARRNTPTRAPAGAASLTLSPGWTLTDYELLPPPATDAAPVRPRRTTPFGRTLDSLVADRELRLAVIRDRLASTPPGDAREALHREGAEIKDAFDLALLDAQRGEALARGRIDAVREIDRMRAALAGLRAARHAGERRTITGSAR